MFYSEALIRKQDYHILPYYWRVILTVCHLVGFYMNAHKTIYVIQSGVFTCSKLHHE